MKMEVNIIFLHILVICINYTKMLYYFFSTSVRLHSTVVPRLTKYTEKKHLKPGAIVPYMGSADPFSSLDHKAAINT